MDTRETINRLRGDAAREPTSRRTGSIHDRVVPQRDVRPIIEVRHIARQRQKDHEVLSPARKPSSSSGPLCFSHRIWTEPFPEKFRVSNIDKYNGDAKPETWLANYLIAVTIARGIELNALGYLPLLLADLAQAWLNSLPEDSIYDWDEFEEVFTKNF